jgi:hypothetical protein
MTNVLIEDVPRLDEAELSQHLVVCDKTGRVLGHYLPAELYNRLVCQSASSQVSTEELQRRLREPGAKSLSEIWSRLEKS